MTNDIIDGRVIIAFKDPPDIPIMDPNYFDIQHDLDTDPYYQSFVYHYEVTETTAGLTQVYDPEIAAFLAAENVEVYSEWPEVGGMGVLLPPGQTVLDAVLNWLSEYPDLIESADPDVTLETCDLPDTMPNDDIYDNYRLSWHLFPDNELTAPDWWAPNEPPISPYSCDASSAWGPPIAALGGGVYIGIFDTGVNYGNPGLQENSALHGINTYDDGKYSSAKLRTQGGGEPWDDLMERSQAYASGLGHGTGVAGTACAAADDDLSSNPPDVHDVLGVAPAARYFPFAIKAKGIGNEEDRFHAKYSMSAILNAFSALGGIKGIYEDWVFEDPAIGI